MYTSHIAGWWIYISTLCLVIAVTVVYYFCVSTFKKWEKLIYILYIKPIPFFGNILNQALGKSHALEFYNKFYYEFTGHRYGGLFQMRTPYLMIRDPELINDVLIKDFLSFFDRAAYSDFVVNPLSNNLLFMNNSQWRVMRNKLSSAFTPRKLKLISKRKQQRNINKRFYWKYSTDIIGTCIFGLKLNYMCDDDSKFRKYGKFMFTPSLKTLFRQLCLMINPTILNVVRLKYFPTKVTDFFHMALKETITCREENKIIRNDFVQVFWNLDTNLPDHVKIKANDFGMFTAGFETVAAIISYCLYELALNKCIQDRVRQEFELKLSQNDGKINNASSLLDMKHCVCILQLLLYSEKLHKHQVPNDSLIIENGQKIIIPIYALHYDNKYYPDPKKFIPERFSAEENAKRSTGVYLPFGDGPQMKHFAEIEMKLAIVEMLTKFEIFTCEKTGIPLKYSNNIFILVPKHGIWLKFKKNN
ncbi:hypothetical protein AGLY_008185 [Aphis glycines]|uniref:Cytochrome P450 n=1 Tax=Aphis glycines TaxID=307491 RepID=A0A6G0TMD3_APHGL|nr:hypothetical protein AGLY_008185 [Aphis glycines]